MRIKLLNQIEEGAKEYKLSKFEHTYYTQKLERKIEVLADDPDPENRIQRSHEKLKLKS